MKVLDIISDMNRGQKNKEYLIIFGLNECFIVKIIRKEIVVVVSDEFFDKKYINQRKIENSLPDPIYYSSHQSERISCCLMRFSR